MCDAVVSNNKQTIVTRPDEQLQIRKQILVHGGKNQYWVYCTHYLKNLSNIKAYYSITTDSYSAVFCLQQQLFKVDQRCQLHQAMSGHIVSSFGKKALLSQDTQSLCAVRKKRH